MTQDDVFFVLGRPRNAYGADAVAIMRLLGDGLNEVYIKRWLNYAGAYDDERSCECEMGNWGEEKRKC